MGFNIPLTIDQVLFEATLEPTTPAFKKLSKVLDDGEAEIGTVAGKKAIVAVGVPYYEDLISRLEAMNEKIPHKIAVMLPYYDFHFVSFSCSFLPDSGCRLVWARFAVELSAYSLNGELLEEKPIAYDIFPNEISNETEYENVIQFDAELKINLGVVAAAVNAEKATKQKNLLRYTPLMYAFNIGRSKPGWNFEDENGKSILGNKKNLLMIIQTPKNSKVRGKFLLGAKIKFKPDGVISLPIARSHKEDEAVKKEYDLSR